MQNSRLVGSSTTAKGPWKSLGTFCSVLIPVGHRRLWEELLFGDGLWAQPSWGRSTGQRQQRLSSALRTHRASKTQTCTARGTPQGAGNTPEGGICVCSCKYMEKEGSCGLSALSVSGCCRISFHPRPAKRSPETPAKPLQKIQLQFWVCKPWALSSAARACPDPEL